MATDRDYDGIDVESAHIDAREYERRFPMVEAGDPPPQRLTVWENPTNQDVVTPLHVGTVLRPNFGKDAKDKPWLAPRNRSEKEGIIYVRIPARSERTLSSDFDMGVQQLECVETSCAGRTRLCNATDHRKIVVGGLGPQLIRKGSKRAPLADGLVDKPVALAAPRQPTISEQDMSAEDRAMQRAAARRAGGAK